MRTIAFRLECPAGFQHCCAGHEQEKSDAYPINFFHSENSVYFYKGECKPKRYKTKRNFKPLPYCPFGARRAGRGDTMKRILVAPLNWGLGHVTRCIPLIQALREMGVEVFLASDGAALHLLRAEFPLLPTFELPSYRIRYESNNMVRNMIRQLPRILYAIRSEQWATERLVKEYGLQGILSDNRYGCFSGQADSVMLTHQLHLRVPGQLVSWGANQVLQMALAKFDHLWVPDVAEAPGLSGQLSHGETKVHPDVRFIGSLSRMSIYPADPEYDVAVVLSGPEPQRTLLEQRLLEQAMPLSKKFIFIQGKPQSKAHHFEAEHVEIVSYMTSRNLNDVLLASQVIVCRSGYSSIMDLAALGKKAILIPTPGQTEQEYLAESLATQNIFLTQPQEQIDLEAGLQAVKGTMGIRVGAFSGDGFGAVLEAWVKGL